MLTITHPGKLGDLLWALPTVRALAQDEPVDLWVPAQLQPLVNLLEKQWYIRDVHIDYNWQVQDTAPASPIVPPDFIGDSSNTIHLGLTEWPRWPLPFQYEADQEVTADYAPWISIDSLLHPVELVVSWTDRWFELKVGLTELLCQDWRRWLLLNDPQSARWPAYHHSHGTTLENVARAILGSRLVLCDNSVTMVLCAALGRRCVVVEPEPDRHHPVFWPGSLISDGLWRQSHHVLGERIFPVLGIDGKPTFDARHTRDLIELLLKEPVV